MPKCAACGLPLAPKPGRGRPRKFCTACVPPGTGAASIQAWRAVNQPKVAAYNARRRKNFYAGPKPQPEVRAGRNAA